MQEVTQHKPSVEENLTATNGGIGIGSIHIGRDAGRNIAFGAHNLIDAGKKVSHKDRVGKR